MSVCGGLPGVSLGCSGGLLSLLLLNFGGFRALGGHRRFFFVGGLPGAQLKIVTHQEVLFGRVPVSYREAACWKVGGCPPGGYMEFEQNFHGGEVPFSWGARPESAKP